MISEDIPSGFPYEIYFLPRDNPCLASHQQSDIPNIINGQHFRNVLLLCHRICAFFNGLLYIVLFRY